MLQVKEYAIYFHLLTNRNTILYVFTCNYFYYNLTNLTYFNTYIYEMAQKKGADFTADTLKTLNTMKKPLIFLIGNIFLLFASRSQ